MTRRLSTFIAIILGFGYFLWHANNTEYVNVYDWYGMLPREVLQQFETETGIRVRYDMYDDNDMLEAKLLASNCGYDVVFPSVSPYVARHIQIGLYQPLNKDWIPNLKQPLHSLLIREMQKVDPQLTYCIPYYWGTVGVLYDADRVENLIKQHHISPDITQSYGLIFDEHWLQYVAPFGVSWLAESSDVFTAVSTYLQGRNNSINEIDLKTSFHQLQKARPHIKRFAANRFIHDMLSGDVCIAHAWSGEAFRAIELGKQMGRRLAYIVPKEGTVLWIDGMVIPKGAPHIRAAHVFMNFLLRPDISAKLMQSTRIPTCVIQSYDLISINLKQQIMPPEGAEIALENPNTPSAFERERTRLFARVRMMD